jgi:DNA-binding NarL/FixJ family response regulator
MSPSVLIAEDHTLVSQGLETMLSLVDGLDLVGAVDTGEAAVQRVRGGGVDVVLMDVNLGKGMNGIEATRQIRETSPDTKVLMLTMYTDPGTVAQAMKAGANGYLSKGSSREVISRAIEDVMSGRSVLDPAVTEGVLGRIEGRSPEALSDRELEILQLVANGKSNAEVAGALFVAEDTVKSTLKNVFRKLDVHDRTEAVAEAFRRGLVR